MMPTEERISTLEHQMLVLTWLHAEVAYKHAGLVVELKTIMRQLLGPSDNPTRDQAIRQRAIRLARIRNAAAAQKAVNQ